MPWRDFPEQKADEPRWWERDDAGRVRAWEGEFKAGEEEPTWRPLPSVEELTDEVVGLMLEGEGLAYATGPTPMPTDPDEPPLIDRVWLEQVRRYELAAEVSSWGHAHVDPIGGERTDGGWATMVGNGPIGDPVSFEEMFPGYVSGSYAEWLRRPPRPPWWARAIGWLLAAWIAVQR